MLDQVFMAASSSSSNPPLSSSLLSSSSYPRLFPHLTYLEGLPSHVVRNDDMFNISQQPCIRELSIYTGITAPGFCWFSGLASSLVKLSLYDYRFREPSDSDMGPLVSLRNLKYLLLSGFRRITADIFLSLAAMPRLESLELLQCTAITKLAPVRACAHRLRVLRFRSRTYTRVSDEDADALSHMCVLDTLHLGACPLSDIGMAKLCSVRTLRVLEMDCDWVLEPNAFLHLRALCDSVEELLLPQCSDLADALCYLTSLRKMRRLLFTKNRLTDEQEAMLRQHMPRLETLHYSDY